MAGAAPWIKFFSGDFLNGVADLEADERGVYITVLALIWDRGAPIADDPAWIARRAGTSTRRFNQIRARLIELGKLEARHGLIANRRAILEIEARDKKSDQARSAALSRWHGLDQPQLPLDGDVGTDDAPVRARARRRETPDYLEKNGGFSQEQDVLISGKSERKRRKTATSDDADAFSPSRARAFQSPETRVIQTTDSPRTPARDAEPEPEAPPPPAKPEPLDRRDLKALMDACSEASGYWPTQPGHIAKAMDTIKGWRDLGIDFDQIVIPTIRHTIAQSPDPTSSFARFDKRVRHEHARKAAQPKTGGAAYKPPEAPMIEVEGEIPLMASIRRELLERLGPTSFAILINPIRLEPVEDAGGGRKPLRVIDNRPTTMKLENGPNWALLGAIAKRHGFDSVWT